MTDAEAFERFCEILATSHPATHKVDLMKAVLAEMAESNAPKAKKAAKG